MTPPQYKLNVQFGAPSLDLGPKLSQEDELSAPLVSAPVLAFPDSGIENSFIQPPLNRDRFQLKTSNLFSVNYRGIYPSIAVRDSGPLKEKTSSVQAPTWASFVQQVGNSVYSADVNFYNVSVNRGSNLHRFSEYTPRGMRPDRASVALDHDIPTIAHAHGEIRPIEGSDRKDSGESLITRVIVDFIPNVTFMQANKAVPNLEIDGFSAVDPPQMEFDRTFSHPNKIVLSVKGGNYDYENPLETGESLATPFGSIRPAPPGGHKYWMFRFSPVKSTMAAGLETLISNGAIGRLPGYGALLLWAFLPTFGLYEENHFKDFNIPYNTFPRKFGDLLAQFFPTFGKAGEKLRQKGPLLNPNIKYVRYIDKYTDQNGVEQIMPDNPMRNIGEINKARAQLGLSPIRREEKIEDIPEDPNEVIKINKNRGTVEDCTQSKGDPRICPIGRKRGSVLDWIFTDLAKDSKRLFKTTTLPYGTFHANFRDATWRLPYGSVEIRSTTDLNLKYRIDKSSSENAGESRARLNLHGEIKPLDLGAIDLTIAGIHLKAKSFKVKEGVFDWQNIAKLAGANAAKDVLPILGNFKDIEAEGLEIANEALGLTLTMDHAEIGSVNVTKTDGADPNSLKIEMKGIASKNFAISTQNDQAEGMKNDLKLPLGIFNIADAEIPEITFLETRDDQGELQSRKLEIPKIASKGSISLTQKNQLGQPIRVDMEGDSKLETIRFDQIIKDRQTHTQASAKFSGDIKKIKINYPWLSGGEGQVSTEENTEAGIVHHPISGEIHFDSSDADAKKSYEAKIALPYIAIEAAGRLKVKSGTSALKNTTLTINSETVAMETEFDIHNASLEGFSDKPTEIARFTFGAKSPTIEGLNIKGRGRFEFLPDGWRITRSADQNALPPTIHFQIKEAELEHTPDLSNQPIGKLQQSKVIKSDVKIFNAEVELEKVSQIEYRQFGEGAERRGRFTQLDFSPTIHHIKGGGDIWVNLFIWGYVRGHFPELGKEIKTSKRKVDIPSLPARDPLLAGLPKQAREKLKDGDFFHIGRVQFSRHSNDTWETHFKDFIFHLHETGGRGQFGLIRIPEFNARATLPPLKPSDNDQKNKPIYDFDLGPGGFLLNIFLNDPERGGRFRFHRWL